MTQTLPVKLGLSQALPCNYIPAQNEQLLVILQEDIHNKAGYEKLLEAGFRRSGEQIYRPHCLLCQQCESIRVLAQAFKPSKSQKRKMKKAKIQFTVEYSHKIKDEYFALYEKYIAHRHKGSSMYPANLEQYNSFIQCSWIPITYIELKDNNRIIAVAVTDTLDQSLSAIYTFFDPDYDHFSLGSVMIMEQITLAKIQNKPYVYLGFQIDTCTKMNYKKHYLPNERFISQCWQLHQ